MTILLFYDDLKQNKINGIVIKFLLTDAKFMP